VQAGKVRDYGPLEWREFEIALCLFLTEEKTGEGTPSLFPPPQSFGGPGAPPPAAAEVSTGLPPVTPEETPAAALVCLIKLNGRP